MKKTQWISLFMTIKKNIISFLAIILFVSLSIGIYSAMGWASEASERSADSIFCDKNVHSFELNFPYGATEADLDKLLKADGVDAVEGANVAYANFINKGFRNQAAIYQITDKIDEMQAVEGKLPKRLGEIAVEDSWAKAHNIKIGDTIIFEKDDSGKSRLVNTLLSIDDIHKYDSLENISDLYKKSDSGMAYLNTDKYKVTAIVKPSFVIYNTKICFGFSAETKKVNDCLFFVHKDSFDETAFNGYRRVVVHADSVDGEFLFSDKYKNDLIETQKGVEAVAKDISKERYEIVSKKSTDITDEVGSELADGKKKLDDAKKKLDAGEKKIQEGNAKLTKAKAKIEKGDKKIAEGEKALSDAKAQVEDAENQVRDEVKKTIISSEYVKSVLAIVKARHLTELEELIDKEAKVLEEKLYSQSVEKTYAYMIVIYNQANEHVDDLRDLGLSDAEILVVKGALQAAKLQLDEMSEPVNKISQAKAQINQGEAKLNDAKAKLAQGKKQYEEGRQKLAKYKKLYNEGLAQYNEGLKKYEKGKKQYQDLKDLSRNIEDYGYAITNTTENQSFIVTEVVSDIIKNTRKTLAALFIVVALMVSFAVIARLVNESIRQIGTKKALGMRSIEILMEYIFFSGCALVVSMIIGGTLAYFIIEPIFINAMSEAYTGANLHRIMDLKDFAFVSTVNVIFLLVVTWATVRKVVNRNTISLLNEEEISSSKTRFYEKWEIYKKMTLLSQIIVNNCVNDRRRVAATIIGVAGCAALVVTAFAYADIAGSNLDIQFSKYSHYKYVVTFDSSVSGAEKEIRKALDDENIDNALVFSDTSIITVPSGVSGPLFVRVAVDKNYGGLITPVTDYDNDKDAYNGLWFSKSIKKSEKLSPEDKLKVKTLGGASREIKPSGYIYSYVLSMFMYADQESYEKAFDTHVEGNTFIIQTDKSAKEVNGLLFDIPGYKYIDNYLEREQENFKQITSMTDIMRAVYATLSLALAVLVLLNLFVMFVNEKRKELIVMIINGYTYHDARRYIYSDTIVLTIIGIVLGVLIGEGVANIAVGSFESIQTIFCSMFDWKAAAIGALSTAVLTFVMSYISLRGVSKLDLTDLTK